MGEVLHELGRIVEFVRDSPKILAGFAAKEPATALRPLCPTRWGCRDASVRSVLANYGALQQYLEELAEDARASVGASSTASGFVKLMNSFLFFFCASLLLKLLHLVTPFIRAVQTAGAAEKRPGSAGHGENLLAL